ncbi:MAG: hypothetical protein SCARUB_01357 [Candidatus Scalindua rubra]|uniref:Uncharacterized protein n=1 Tax=Candidatus Scalindua rubra TaxID=1872076 RepID=A0A1E3XD37_9BACT|nr:MAG: hypothetical protein SCARUB_01357 [Candidatus Scalindua rubra]
MAVTKIPKFVQDRFRNIIPETIKEITKGIFRAEVFLLERSEMISAQCVYWSEEAFLTLTVGKFRFSDYLQEFESESYELSFDGWGTKRTECFNSLESAEWKAIDILRGKKVASNDQKGRYYQDDPAQKYRRWTS